MTFVHCDSVIIKWHSERSLSASVRDGAGIHDVVFTVDGWSCSCGEPHGCSHVLAVKDVGAVCS